MMQAVAAAAHSPARCILLCSCVGPQRSAGSRPHQRRAGLGAGPPAVAQSAGADEGAVAGEPVPRGSGAHRWGACLQGGAAVGRIGVCMEARSGGVRSIVGRHVGPPRRSMQAGWAAVQLSALLCSIWQSSLLGWPMCDVFSLLKFNPSPPATRLPMTAAAASQARPAPTSLSQGLASCPQPSSSTWAQMAPRSGQAKPIPGRENTGLRAHV